MSIKKLGYLKEIRNTLKKPVDTIITLIRDKVSFIMRTDILGKKIKGTDDIITSIGDIKSLGVQKLQGVEINNKEWIIINPKTLEALKVKGTEDIITDAGDIKSLGGQKIQEVKVNNKKQIFINPKTLETIKVKAIDQKIVKI